MDTRKTGWALLVCCLFAGVTLAGTADVADKDITEKIVGKWSEEINEDGVKGKATMEYKKDGTMTGEGTLEVNGQNIKVTIECKWKAENGNLVVTFEKVTPDGLIPQGHVSKDKILSIDDKSCTYKDEKGKERKMTRLKD
jgi:hypothetical protein